MNTCSHGPGRGQALRRQLQQAESYEQWKEAAIALDQYLGNDEWKHTDPYSYYNHQTVKKVSAQLSALLGRIELAESQTLDIQDGRNLLEELKLLLEGCIKNNFVGVESRQLYSETYLGTKDLVQTFVDQVQKGTWGSTRYETDHPARKGTRSSRAWS